MWSQTSKTLTAATAGLLLVGTVAAPAAMAYPPGNKVQVSTSKGTYKAKSRVKIQLSQLQKGCKVRVKIVGGAGTSFTSSKSRARVSLKAPKKPGKYKVITTVSGAGCDKESGSTRIVVVPKRVPGTG